LITVSLVELLGLLLAGLGIGVMLGTLGGGGAIITAPLLVYVFGVGIHEATGLSLVVVLIAAVTGLLGHARAGRVRWAPGVAFGVTGIVGAVVGSWLARLVPDAVLLSGFAVLLLIAGLAMWRGPISGSGTARPLWLIGLVAVATGLIVGFFGVGGGFVVVPALVLFLGFPMPVAAGTGLLVIAIDSAAALSMRGHQGLGLDLAVPLALGAITGSLVGSHWAGRIPAAGLQRSFAVVMVVVAAGMGLRLAAV
jgi:uncharacterized membrane protein YfcA